LYLIDQEHYIDINEVEKFQKWVKGRKVERTPISIKLAEAVEDDEEDEEEEEIEEEYTPISMNNYLLKMVEQLYGLLNCNVFDKYKTDLNDLSAFKKPDNTFKQIISPDGEIIYVVHFKKHINEPHHSTSIGYEKLNWDIKISIDDIFDINHLYPLNLSKILNEKKIKDSPYT
jgi:DNA repair ATPase RecN